MTVKVKQKDNGSIEIKPLEGEKAIDNKLQLLTQISEVQSRIKDDISSDFIYAKLGSQDKEGVIEMTGNAYFFKRLVKIIQLKAHRWEWDGKTRVWSKKTLAEDEIMQSSLISTANRTFDSYMTKVFMTVNLNRNVDKNHILKMLSGYDNDDEEGDEEGKAKKSIESAKEEIMAQLAPNTVK